MWTSVAYCMDFRLWNTHFNRKPKDLKRESRGFSDFNYTRNRILWATRDNPSVRGIPKSKDEIKKNKGKKRGSYNKKK